MVMWRVRLRCWSSLWRRTHSRAAYSFSLPAWLSLGHCYPRWRNGQVSSKTISIDSVWIRRDHVNCAIVFNTIFNITRNRWNRRSCWSRRRHRPRWKVAWPVEFPIRSHPSRWPPRSLRRTYQTRRTIKLFYHFPKAFSLNHSEYPWSSWLPK